MKAQEVETSSLSEERTEEKKAPCYISSTILRYNKETSMI